MSPARLLFAAVELGCGTLATALWLEASRRDGDASGAAKGAKRATRGRILDRNGVALAETRERRRYPLPAVVAHLIGHLGVPGSGGWSTRRTALPTAPGNEG